MSLGRTNYILSNVNALLGSTVGAINDHNNGVDPGTTTMNFGLNVMNGTVRNAVAYDMYQRTGTNLGFMINGMAGYGNQEANVKGSTALMGASIMNSMFNPFGGCFGGGWVGGSVFGPMVPMGGFYSYMGPSVFAPPPVFGFGCPPMHSHCHSHTHVHRHFCG